MNKVILLYSCDIWCSNSSQVLVGVYDNEDILWNTIKKLVDEESFEIKGDYTIDEIRNIIESNYDDLYHIQNYISYMYIQYVNLNEEV